jgi:hypothetical protein
MRFASLFVVLAIANASYAQGGAAAVASIWGGTPRQIVNVPIDTSKALGPGNVSKAFKTPSSQLNSPMNLGGIFPSLSLPSWPPKIPQVSVLPQKLNPFQPTPPKGAVNLLNYPTPKKK